MGEMNGEIAVCAWSLPAVESDTAYVKDVIRCTGRYGSHSPDIGEDREFTVQASDPGSLYRDTAGVSHRYSDRTGEDR